MGGIYLSCVVGGFLTFEKKKNWMMTSVSITTTTTFYMFSLSTHLVDRNVSKYFAAGGTKSAL
jgi:hypothetical protein